MEDGVRLAVSLFLPEGAEEGRAAPVVLEALPYRKDDAHRVVPAGVRAAVREDGYAVARVDLRGTGSSEGVATDEYPASEQADLCRGDRVAGRAAVVDRARSGCTGRRTRGSTRSRWRPSGRRR